MNKLPEELLRGVFQFFGRLSFIFRGELAIMEVHSKEE